MHVIFLFCLSIEGETPLGVEPAEIFLGNEVKFTCGPPPESVNFGSDWNAEWRRDNILIPPDSQHSFSKLPEDNIALLTVSRFFNTDTGKEINPA